jgi:hypothetical protein
LDNSEISSSLGLSKIEQATITLTHEDDAVTHDPTGITLGYQLANFEMSGPSRLRMSFNLVITHKEKDICGAVHFFATLAPSENEMEVDELGLSPKLSIHLIDHSAQICKADPSQIWEATVEENDPLSGRTNATLLLGGIPKSVLTIY